MRATTTMFGQTLKCVRPLAAAALAAACGEPVPVPTTVTVSPATTTLHAFDETVRLTAAVQDQNGEAMPDVAVRWSSGDESVVTVDAGGLAKAMGNGSAAVRASVEDVGGTAQVTVEQQVVAVRVSPDEETLRAFGDTVRLSAAATDANGHLVEGADFTWSSDDESVVSVDASGLVTATGNGIAAVRASLEDVAGSAEVTVEQQAVAVRVSPDEEVLWALGDTVRLSAAATDANGHLVEGADFTWSSDDESVVTVDAAGLATATGHGMARVRAETGTVEGDATVSVDLQRGWLRTFYEMAGGPLWNVNYGWVTDAPLDSWYGVSTGPEGNVTGLELDENGLTGSIASVVANLWSLRTFDVWKNELTGPIPSEFGDLVNLETLIVGWNRLSGTIPPGLGNLRKLTWLTLSMNQLSGPIPSELGNLKELEALWLGDNQLTGSIPPELGNLQELQALHFRDNQLTGAIPPELGNLQKLRWLLGSHNQLTGTIPPELGKLTDLGDLFLSDNRLTGTIPPELSSLEKLSHLGLNANQLTGAIPAWLGTLRSLFELSLSDNQLTGTIPPELGDIPSLSVLALSDNRLTGAIPPEFGETEIEFLYLSGNRLTGSIPPELGDARYIEWLDLSDNRLTGSIPAELGSPRDLWVIDLSGNQLTDTIPPRLRRLTYLQRLDLSDNQLAGSIPSELGNLEDLEGLLVSGNAELSGALPSQLLNLALSKFHWYDTDLCAPTDDEFQEWLDSIDDEEGEGDCDS